MSPQTPISADPAALAGYELVLCVCGGIAACKAAQVVSALVQRGAGVSVAMTENATRFIGALTFSALTARPVHLSQWPADGAGEIQHLRLTERADLVVVAPATANMIGKAAGGLADDLVSALLLGSAAPVLFAPAMNARMWAHAAVQRNVAWLRETGAHFVGPDDGWLACRDVGPGRMSEPGAIVSAVEALLRQRPAKARPAGGP